MVAVTAKRLQLHPSAALFVAVAVAAIFLWAARDTATVEELQSHGVTDTISLTFADMPGGIVEAHRAEDGALLARFVPGEGGFVRQTMRGFAIERRKADISREQPFELARMASGHLLLSDPATGRVVALDAFGQTNAGVFAGMLNRGRETR